MTFFFSWKLTLVLVFWSGLRGNDYYYYYHITPGNFFTPALADGLHRSLCKSKSPQVSRILHSILANLCNAVIWMTHPLISSSSILLTKPLGTIPFAPIIISINVSFLFHSFFLVLWQGPSASHFFCFLWFSLCGIIIILLENIHREDFFHNLAILGKKLFECTLHQEVSRRNGWDLQVLVNQVSTGNS